MSLPLGSRAQHRQRAPYPWMRRRRRRGRRRRRKENVYPGNSFE